MNELTKELYNNLNKQCRKSQNKCNKIHKQIHNNLIKKNKDIRNHKLDINYIRNINLDE